MKTQQTTPMQAVSASQKQRADFENVLEQLRYFEQVPQLTAENDNKSDSQAAACFNSWAHPDYIVRR